MSRSPRPAAVVACALAIAASLADAQHTQRPRRGDDPRIDPESGRHQAHWTRSPQVDFRHMRLELDLSDMDSQALRAVQTLTVVGLAMPRQTLTLDAHGLHIDRVEVDAQTADFAADDRTLTIRFPDAPIQPGQQRTIRIEYHAEYPEADGLGLNWSLGEPGGRSRTDRFAQIHSQGQSENNARWFPCHDAPNDRLSTELIVRAPEPYVVISNGRLVSTKPVDAPEAAASDATIVEWHYLQERPHPTYLVTLVVGVFDQVRLAGPGVPDAPTDIPMAAYGPVGSGDTMREVFAETPAMLAFFERWLDEPYPWDRYDQVCVREFHSGGMENTAATTLYEEASRSTADRERDLLSHELAHMWFGDLITCRTWDHLWLNEGWAVYAEVLWREERARAAAARDGLPEEIVADEAESAMLEYVLQLLRAQRRFNRARAPHDPALASNLYDDPETTFDRADDPYNKGAGVIHMLRARLGDDVFQRATRAYIDRHRDGLVESDDLRRCFEDVSGVSLERFFTQWVYRPGLPRVQLSIRWDADAGELVIEGEQTQPIDADNPAYTLDIPLHITLGADRTRTIRPETFALHTRTASARIPLPRVPEEVAVDPRLTIFADVRVDKNLAWWRHEAEHGPTIASRLLAAEALAAHADAIGMVAERRTAASTDSQN